MIITYEWFAPLEREKTPKPLNTWERTLLGKTDGGKVEMNLCVPLEYKNFRFFTESHLKSPNFGSFGEWEHRSKGVGSAGMLACYRELDSPHQAFTHHRN